MNTVDQVELYEICKTYGELNDLTDIQAEYKFHPARKWRFDYALPEIKLAIELDGGVWISGRHNRGSGFVKDMEKFNEAAILGWRVLRFTPKDVRDGKAMEIIDRAIKYAKECIWGSWHTK